MSQFVIEPFEPAYLALHRTSELQRRAEVALRKLEDCCVCPRNCHVNRLANQAKVCRTGRYARVTSAFAHHGEEDCLRGTRGSGTIFFAQCNLRCVFCQNWDISQTPAGRELRPDQIADLMMALQEAGCHNINFVTPEHVVPQVIEAVAEAVNRGLRVPLVYNTSAYDSCESLRLLDGIIDIYMPDFKFWEPETARRLTKAPDYPERAREAIREMHRQVGSLRFGPDGTARRGLLIRHLVMPGLGDETAAIMQWLATEVSPDTFVNIMAQCHPSFQVGQRDRRGEVTYAAINRRPTAEEIRQAFDVARRAGLWRFDWEP
ncbi:MAG TPA: radical SAM protein [Planctomycetaceae bacterium]|nr:radical SAM protein [Planctomycetaceae bacterium]